ncbi:hypothetical protein ACTHQF_06025 [Pedobacter sp. SAFR-022]|uniref:hypothetical protein n=1 Tax=Pedobacter sp. SAFR-022 TaxID=3436861 RepID=UPI003F80D759
MKTNTTLLRAAYLLLLISGTIAIFFLRSLSGEYTIFGQGEIDMAKTGAVGDFIAGSIGTIFSLTGLILVLVTYRDQRLANLKDKKESRVFTLIQIQVNNAENMTYKNPYKDGEN